MFATTDPMGYAVYPDSDKIGFWADDGNEFVRVKRGSKIDYYEGEL
jgi:hypothetical protein